MVLQSKYDKRKYFLMREFSQLEMFNEIVVVSIKSLKNTRHEQLEYTSWLQVKFMNIRKVPIRY